MKDRTMIHYKCWRCGAITTDYPPYAYPLIYDKRFDTICGGGFNKIQKPWKTQQAVEI